MHSYDDLQKRWKALRAAGEMTVREVACSGAPRTMLCAESGDRDAPAVTIAAGVHGDEPAGPWALLSLAENAELDCRYAYRLWPCTNPSGFLAGTRENAGGEDVNRSFGRGGTTPESRAVIVANRDRKYVLSLDLHEDDALGGFYCYEYGEGGIGERIASAVSEAGFPLEAEPVLRPAPHLEADAIGGISYTLSIVRHAAARALTLETPTRLPLEARIEIHRIAVKAAIAALENRQPYG